MSKFTKLCLKLLLKLCRENCRPIDSFSGHGVYMAQTNLKALGKDKSHFKMIKHRDNKAKLVI